MTHFLDLMKQSRLFFALFFFLSRCCREKGGKGRKGLVNSANVHSALPSLFPPSPVFASILSVYRAEEEKRCRARHALRTYMRSRGQL